MGNITGSNLDRDRQEKMSAEYNVQRIKAQEYANQEKTAKSTRGQNIGSIITYVIIGAVVGWFVYIMFF